MVAKSVKRKKKIANIKRKLLMALKKQGFKYKKGKLIIKNNSKNDLKKLNSAARKHMLEKNVELIERHDADFVSKYIADGTEVIPEKISPRLILIGSDDIKESNLFRWVKLHWSIPISAGYGRRLRYLVMDEHNGKLIGIIGLADPVYGLKDRDEFIGWDMKTKSKKLKHLMDGFVIGAVPPYSHILGGKLVASLIGSDKVARDFHRKYHGKRSLISGKKFKGNLVAVTTSSAFGKSSMYDRIKVPEGPEFLHVGWTKGSGEFQFINGEYQKLFNITKKLKYSGKNKKWGKGPRNRRVVVSKALEELGLSQDLLYHGIKRELFLVPLAKNWKDLLQGKNKNVKKLNNAAQYIATQMLNRWVIPRSIREKSYIDFKKEDYSLINK